MCKIAFPDSEIDMNAEMEQAKMAYVIQYGITFNERLSLNDVCTKHLFSIIIDENIDIYVSQIFVAVVRYLDTDREDAVGYSWS